MKRRCAVLGYHKIGPPSVPGWETWFYISTAVFASQLETARRLGWQFIDARRFLHGLREPDALPEKSCLVTFDDAYRSLPEHALPVLRAACIPSVVFVPAKLVGGTNVFDRDNEPQEFLCSWEDLAFLSRNDCSIQSHGMNHARFSDLEPAQRRTEIFASRDLLESRAGTAVRMFSFPYGDNANDAPDVRKALSGAGMEAAFLYGGGIFSPCETDPFAIPRLAVGPDTDLAAALADPGFAPERRNPSGRDFIQ